MSESQVRALAEALYEDADLGPGYMGMDDCLHLAQRLLASPWMAEHDQEMRAEIEALKEENRLLLEDPRDEHHTMAELYEYRMLYHALLVNEWEHTHRRDLFTVKSWFHSDGEECFGGGWFIVVSETPVGQISNHYKAEHWDLFQVPAVHRPPPYDGHTPAEAAGRMRLLASQRRGMQRS